MNKKTIIKETDTTPQFELNAEKGIITLRGRSIPTDPDLFFEPILSLVDNYLVNPANKTVANIRVDYLNTPSDKYLLRIFRKLEVTYKTGKDIAIIWCYEEDDEDMQKTGDYYKSILKIPFQLKEVKEI